jgi:hypothetical protein
MVNAPSPVQTQYFPFSRRLKKCLQYWNIFVVLLGTLLKPVHIVAQGQLVSCCKVHFLLTERVKGAEIHHVSYFVPLLMCK